MKPKVWDRKLWGVALAPNKIRDCPSLLVSSWDNSTWQVYAGQPTRPMIFQTRKQCHAWIAAHRGDYFAKQYRCVRVRERVEVIE